MTTEQKSMTVRLSGDQAAALETVARAQNRSVAEEIREAIDARIDALRKDKEFQRRLAQSIERDRELLDRLART